MTGEAARPLKDVSVLIVEDRYLIASELAHEVQAFGGRVAGVAASISKANAILDRGAVDVAVLDVNLDGEEIYPLAERLAQDGRPFLFLSGYDEWLLPEKWRGRPRLSKPLAPGALRDTLLRLVSLAGEA